VSIYIVSVGGRVARTDGGGEASAFATSVGAKTITATFGDLKTSSSNAPLAGDSIVLGLKYTVLDAAAVKQGEQLQTSAVTTYTPADGFNGAIDVTVAKNVGVVEPSISLTDTAFSKLTDVDAGDTVDFKVTVVYNGDAASTAYDGAVKATLPASLTPASTPICVGNGCGSFTFTENSDGFTFDFGALTDSVKTAAVSFEATVATTVTPGSNIGDASYALTFEGLPSDSACAGSSRSYTESIASDTVVAQVVAPSGSFALTDSSRTESSGSNVAVHETVELTATVVLGAGRSTITASFKLPVDGSTVLLESPTLAVNSIGSGVARVDGQQITVDGQSLSGRTLSVALGALQIDAGASSTRSITLLLSFAVSAISAVETGLQLPIVGSLTYDNSGSLALGTITLVASEPTLTPTVQCTPTSGVETGSTISCMLNLVHDAASTAAAHDVEVKQTLGSGLTFDASSFKCTPACGSGTTLEKLSASVLAASVPTLVDTQKFEWDLLVGPVADVQPDEELSSSVGGNYQSVPVADNQDFTGRSYNIATNTLTSQTKPLSAAFQLDSTSIGETVGANVAPGETVTFEVEVTAPAVSTDLKVVVKPGSAALELQGITLVTPLANGVTVDGVAGEIVTNGNAEMVVDSVSVSAASAGPLRFLVEAVVVATGNDAAESGASLTATGQAFFRNTPLSAATVTLTVVEPDIAWTKVTTATVEGDAGDAVTVYGWLRLNANAAAAYNLEVNFTVPSKISVESDTVACALPAGHGQTAALKASTCAGAGGAVGTVATGEGWVHISFAKVTPGTEVQVACWGTLQNSVNPLEDLVIAVDYQISSTPDGEAGAKIYDGNDSFAVTVPNTPSLSFVLDSTSDALTSGSSVTINEEATFIATVTVPQVTTPLVVQIVVPATVEILSAEVQTVGGAISDASLSGGDDLSSAISDLGGGVKQIEADFGTIANNYDGSGGSDNTLKVVVVVRALDTQALSGFSPQSTVTLSSEMDFTHASPTTKTSALTVVEPELVATMPSLSAEADAGDIATFTITLDHASKSTSSAHDVILHIYLQDHLAVGFDMSGSLTMVPATSHTLIAVNATYFTIEINKLLLVDLIKISVPVEVEADARPGEELALGVVVDWTSIVPQGSVIGRASESALIEATVTCKSLAGAVDLTLDGTSLSDTATSAVVVGEVVYFQSAVTLPELTMELTLTVTLPAGLAFVNASVYSIGGQISGSSLAAGETVSSSSAGSKIVFAFSEVSNVAGADDDQIVVDFYVQVEKVDANKNGKTLTTLVALKADEKTISPTGVAVVVKEPALTVDSVSADKSTADGGDPVTYTIVVQHPAASTSDAYDLVLVATLPSTMAIQSTSGAGDGTITSTSTVATWKITKLAEEDTYTVTFDAIVLNTMHPGATGIACETTLGYDSYPISLLSEEGRAYTAVKTSAALSIPLFNSFTLDIGGTSLSDTTLLTAAIGEVFHFLGVATLPELTMEVDVTATLPAGLVFVNASVLSIGNSISGSSLSEGEAVAVDGVTIAFKFGDLVNAYDNAATSDDQIEIDFFVQVQDTEGNVDGTTLTTAAVAVADGTDVPADNIALVVKEPELIVKSVTGDKTSADGGDVITYTIVVEHTSTSTADGYDLVLEATVPATMQVQSTTGNGDGQITTSDTVATWQIPTLAGADTYTVTLKAMVLNTMKPGAAAVVCEAALDYDSYPETRLSKTGRAYSATKSSAALAIPLFNSFELEVSGTSLTDTTELTAAIGEVVHFQGTVTLPELTVDLDIAATLPSGLLFVNASVLSIGSQVTGSSLAEGEDVAIDGQNIVFDFGEIVNTYDNNIGTDGDQIVVDFYAQVEDISQNKKDSTLTTSATADADGTSVDATDVIVTVAEPKLRVSSATASPTTADGGDVVTYTLVVTHLGSSNADAYDLLLTGTLPGTMEIQSTTGDGDGQITDSSTVATWQIPKLTNGETYTVTLKAMVLNTMHPGAAGIACATRVEYDSYPVASLGEGGRAAFAVLTSAALTIPINAFALAVSETTLDDTALLAPTVGEVLYFEGIVTLPELTMDLDVTVTLPSGLLFLNASVVAVGSDISGSKLAAGEAVAVAGTSIAFDFGDVVNSYDNSAGTAGDKIEIDFYVQVKDVSANKDGVSLTTAGVAVADGAKVTTANVVLVLKEPVIEVKAVTSNPTAGDGGDIITYTIVVEHTAASTADGYDLVLSATLPATMRIQDTGGGAGKGTISESATISTWNVPVLADGDTYTVTVDVLILNTMRPGAAGIVCTTALDYDSYPVLLLGEAGREYSAAKTSAALTIPLFNSFALAAAGTSLQHTEALLVTIGEIIYFKGTMTHPELTLDLNVSATLPVGLGFVNASVLLVGSQVTLGALSEGETVEVAEDGRTIIFDFGEIVNAYDNNAGTGDDKIIIDFYAQVMDVEQSVDGATLKTDASVFAEGTAVSATGVSLVVKEPILEVTRVEADAATADAGDIVTYTIEVDHAAASTSDGYDLVVVATLPDTMQIIDTVNGNGTVAITSSDTVATWQLPRLALTAGYSVTVSAMILNTMRPGAAAIVCKTEVDYDSYPETLLAKTGRAYNATLTSSALSIPLFDSFVLALDGTSLVDTVLLAPTIGEVLYFQGTLTLPELTLDLNVSALLPAGLGFVNASLFSIGSQITVGSVRCAFSDRNLHSRMPLDPTHVRLKRTRV
jgi:uncharacterized repeat protein (TIGR01451 family)